MVAGAGYLFLSGKGWPGTAEFAIMMPVRHKKTEPADHCPQVQLRAGGGTRTHTPSLTTDFEFYRLRGNEWTVIPYGGP